MADPQRIYNLLNEIFLILDDGDRRFFGGFNLTSPRFYALVHIGEQPGISFSELSDRLLCDKSNITRIIKSLEAEGLVVRRRHETDGRVLRLFLSDDGEKLRDKAVNAHNHYNRNRFNPIAEMAQDNLMDGLLGLKDVLQQHLSEPLK